MGLKIVYTEIASEDLFSIYSFIRKGSAFYAKKEIGDIRNAIKKLKNNAFLGKVFEDLGEESTRELIFRNYRIIYKITNDKVINILTIHHHARSISNNPAFKENE